MFKDKWLMIGAVITALILIAGVFFFSRNTGSGDGANKAQNNLLVNDSSYITGGIKDGVFLPKSDLAKVTLVEFGDYQCPACASYSPLVTRLLTDFSGQANFVFRNYVLPQHKNAMVAAQAAEAAGLQGKFWEMNKKIYEAQTEWATASNAEDIFAGYAKDLGLDSNKFSSDFDSQAVKDRIQSDQSDGNLLNVNATPTFYLNGSKVSSPGSYENFKSLIQSAIDNAPAPTSDAETAYHGHFDLKVYQAGVAIDFSQAKYQESTDNPLDPAIHFHDGNGKVVHVHAKDISLRILLESLKIDIPIGALAYVNGKKFDNIVSYIPQDLDQILIGSDNLSSLSNDACIYSLKCPERGTPPPEDCVGGLGTDCEEN